MNFIKRYLHKRREKKRAIAEAEARLFEAQILRVLSAGLKIAAPAIEFYEALNDKTEYEKLAELRLKYLKEKH